MSSGTAAPMAALSTPTNSEPLTVYARACLPDGRFVTLPPQSGTTVRLPAATYDLWCRSADGWIWAIRPSWIRMSTGPNGGLALP